MLKIGLVGCGKIADDHAQQVRRIQDCEIVGACDVEPLMASQFAERFRVPRSFSNLAEFLETCRPDVVHVTTPPQTHFTIARECLDAGCHVYVEKPFTVDASEAIQLITLAERKGLKITAGHDDQFRHAARRMRAAIREGYLGSRPLLMESYYCYELGPSAYVGALLGNKNHWIRRLPGKLLHNIISHGVARVAEYLPTDSPQVIAHGFTSPLLRAHGETEIIDELRVIISDREQVTAYFTFSSQIRPELHQFRVFGSRNGLVLDQDQETLFKIPGKRYKSYAEKFIPPVLMAKQSLRALRTNLGLFAAGDFHMKSGMKFLIESFYRSISAGAEPPIPYREIVLTARIMDEIFTQLGAESHEGQRVGVAAELKTFA